MAIYHFSIWRPSAILDLLCACLDHPWRAFGNLYRCAEFGWNRCSSFDNMHVFRFRELCLKTPIRAPKIGGFGRFESDGETSTKSRKARPWLEKRRMAYRSSKSVQRCDMCAWRRDQKRRERRQIKKQIKKPYRVLWKTMKTIMSSNWSEISHNGWSSGSSEFQVSSKSIKWFRRCERSKFAISHWFGHWLIQQLVAVIVTDVQYLFIIYLFIYLLIKAKGQKGHLHRSKIN